LAFTAINLIITLFAGYGIGLIGMGVDGQPGQWGFGSFSMNINAAVNPVSYRRTWSTMLRIRPYVVNIYETIDNRDGFNYLGMGIFLLGVVCAALFYFKITNERNYGRKVKIFLKNNAILFLFCFGMFLFAVSNVVTFDQHILFAYPIPDALLRYLSFFRASGRMFWVVYYVITLGVIVYMNAHFSAKKGALLFALLFAVQMYDISPALRENSRHFDVFASFEMPEPTAFDELVGQFDYFISDFPLTTHVFGFGGAYLFALDLARNNMIANVDFTNRTAADTANNAHEFWLGEFDALLAGNRNPRAIYWFTHSYSLWRAYVQNVGYMHPVELNNLHFLVNINDSLHLPEEAQILNFFRTNEHWERGFANHSVAFYLPNNAYNRARYEVGLYVNVGENEYRRIGHTADHGAFLHVYLMGDRFCLDALGYPDELWVGTRSFFITDYNWERGYARLFVGFLVPNDYIHREIYQVGAYVHLNDNDARRIMHVVGQYEFLHVHLDGDPFDFSAMDYPVYLPVTNP